jgi:hypothetical protein
MTTANILSTLHTRARLERVVGKIHDRTPAKAKKKKAKKGKAKKAKKAGKKKSSGQTALLAAFAQGVAAGKRAGGKKKPKAKKAKKGKAKKAGKKKSSKKAGKKKSSKKAKKGKAKKAGKKKSSKKGTTHVVDRGLRLPSSTRGVVVMPRGMRMPHGVW